MRSWGGVSWMMWPTEQPIGRAHLLGVAFDQIVVDGDDVHGFAGPSPQAGHQGGGDGLALAGGHFGNEALIHSQRADDLHEERAFFDGADDALADDGHAAVQGRAFEPVEAGQHLAFLDGLLEAG
jgi:hypothetical protein